jgi:hypothetical protein
VVEYGSLTAGLAVLISALAGLMATPLASLPTAEGRAIALVSSTAAKENVSAQGARAVYRQAPYRSPFLRYLYTVGWISGSKNSAWCAVDRASGIDAAEDAAKQIRGSVKLRARMRAAHVGVAAASSAIGKGVVLACGLR